MTPALKRYVDVLTDIQKEVHAAGAHPGDMVQLSLSIALGEALGADEHFQMVVADEIATRITQEYRKHRKGREQ